MGSRLRARRPSGGFTLVEVVIAALLLAIGVTALFSVCVSVRFKVNKDVYRSQMDFYGRQLLEDLRSYVTVDTTIMDGAPGNPASWCHPMDDCNDTKCPGGSALAVGDHCVTGMLPSSLSADPPVGVHARLGYNVSVVPMVAGSTAVNVRRVDITMTWNTPD